MERVAGIEPALSGRKHDILPLNYTRNLHDYNIKEKNFQHSTIKNQDKKYRICLSIIYVNDKIKIFYH